MSGIMSGIMTGIVAGSGIMTGIGSDSVTIKKISNADLRKGEAASIHS